MTITTTFPGQGGKNQVSRRALRVSAYDVVVPVAQISTSGRGVDLISSRQTLVVHFYIIDLLPNLLVPSFDFSRMFPIARKTMAIARMRPKRGTVLLQPTPPTFFHLNDPSR